jgi:hypothetical protein
MGHIDLVAPPAPSFVAGPGEGHQAFSSNDGTAWAAQFGVVELSGLEDFTYEMWINLTGDNEGKIIFERQALTNGEPGSGTHRIRYGGEGHEGKLYFEYVGEGSAPDPIEFELADETDAWHHIALTSSYEDISNALYVDGVKVSEGVSFLEPIFGGNQDVVYIGSSRSNPEGLIMHGGVDEVAIYNRVLEEAEVQEHFQAGFPDDYAAAVKGDEPLVYWRFENGFTDDQGLYNLIPTGDVYVPGPGGEGNTALFARVFNTEAQLLYDNITSFTYELWVNFIFESAQSYIFFRNPASQNAVIYAYNENALEFFAMDGGIRPLVTFPNETDQWYYLVLVYDSSVPELRIYQDGELVSTTGGAITQGTGNLVVVGGADLGANFNGYTDEVAMYDYALSEERIQTHFQSPIDTTGIKDWSVFE